MEGGNVKIDDDTLLLIKQTFFNIKLQHAVKHLGKTLPEEKDYPEIVKQDWKSLEVPFKQLMEHPVMTMLAEKQYENNPELKPYAKKLLEYKVKALLEPETTKGLVPKALISGIVHGISDDAVAKIIAVIKPKHFEILWNDLGYSERKLKTAIEERDKLNKVVKQFSGIENLEGVPHIVAAALQDGYALAKAYAAYLDGEIRKARLKPDGAPYESLTRREEWNSIIVDLANILHEEKKRSIKILYLNKTVARLLIAVYPNIWGKLSLEHAERIIKDRLTVRHRGIAGYAYERQKASEAEI